MQAPSALSSGSSSNVAFLAFDTPLGCMDILNNILNNWQAYLGALSAVLVAAIAVAAMVPGDEPEATLQKIVDFIARFSAKK